MVIKQEDMTVKEVIAKLKAFPPDTECALALNESAGFPDDRIYVYPLESVYLDNLKNPKTGTPPIYSYYGLDENNLDKVFFYVFA